MSILSKNLSAKVKHAIYLSKQLGDLEHAVLKGRLRELLVTELIEPLLPNGVRAITGILIDSKGNQSNQLDIIIYSSDILPPIIQSNEQSIIPVDAALQVIEVKSQLNATEIRDSIKKGESVKTLCLLGPRKLEPPFSLIIKEKLSYPIKVSPVFSVFAFGSDLKKKTEWERYLEIKNDPEGSSRELVDDICVVGSGYWNRGEGELISEEAAEDYNEVLRMLIFLVNSIPLWKEIRGTPELGQYFTDPD